MESNVREMTINEEIMALDIDEHTKDRILNKLKRIESEISKTQDYLYNCHCEINILEKGIVSQAKEIGRLEYKIREGNICNNDPF